ncbi:LAFE_0C12618g1_1 [Lachancea fermentati]|uniref:LAFE_0C12618g1_1 n=1 Tax=Lachancea fermentati TaxID=4955 RepID=A0A1G4MAQ2_LACFM|nr:LAFE_0C12618g1_1 [Lachancea fermentati]
MSQPSIQPLHQKPVPTLATSDLHRAMFKKPAALEMKNKFASPTDDLLSPCSQRLNEHKSKLFSANAKPTKLNFATAKHSSDSDSDEE